MKFTTKSAISLTNLFAVIVTFATVSILINIQSVRYTENRGGSDVTSFDQNEILRHMGTGSDVRGFGRSLNQHSDLHSKETEQDIKQTLMVKLTQVEDRLRKLATSPAVAFIGNPVDGKAISGVTLKDQRLYVINMEDDHHRLENGTSIMVQKNWSVIFCADPNECPTEEMDLAQRADVIPALNDVADNPAKLCTISRNIHGSQANKPCCQHGVHSDSPEEQETSGWVQQENGDGGRLQNYTGCKSADNGLVEWRLPKTPILYEAGPLLRLRCLVTSLLPLRMYFSPHTLSGPLPALQEEKYFKQSRIEDTLQYISETYGLGISSQWLSTIKAVLLRYFMNISAEYGGTLQNGCTRCFQLLRVDLVCHSILQCSVIKISNKKRLSAEYLDTVWPIVSPASRVASDVSRSLEVVMSYLPFELCGNEADSINCLTDEDLVYILDDRREFMNIADWIKIYPSTDSHAPNPSTHGAVREAWQWRDIYHRHSLMAELQKYYKRIDGQNSEFSDRDSTSTYLKYDDSMDAVKDFPDYGRRTDFCSTDHGAFGKVASIYTRPELPLLEPSPGQFYANVSYDTILVTLSAIPTHCDNELRLENKYNSPGPKNITLGLGETKIRLYVMDLRVSEPSVVAVIVVTIYRRVRGIKTVRATKYTNIKTCGLKQECSLRYEQEQTCGLFDLNMNWSTYKLLPWQQCKSGNSPGRWVVPCTSCHDASTCYWARSRWQPNTCSYQRLATPSLKQCLKGKKLLFIGDSTNRGILNYIISRINGSLWGWDKTHTVKLYTGVNDNSTVLSFAYYPHFWLPADHRPKFHKVIYQIIKSSLPLENNENTVLVVGGVQWLAKQHIDYVVEALQKKGLSNITKVVKGIGAGFHQPVEGIRYVPKSEHINLAQQEADILAYSESLGFRVAATFNMTMARYKDFLEGKCACHFHKVTKLSSVDNQYTVTGEVNAAYSDIVIDQICS